MIKNKEIQLTHWSYKVGDSTNKLLYSGVTWPNLSSNLQASGLKTTDSTELNARKRLCIKVGWGQGDGDIGTRVWGLGTWDARRGTWGHQLWDAGTCGTGTRGRQIQGRRGGGMWMIIAKVAGKCDISHFPREYVLMKGNPPCPP